MQKSLLKRLLRSFSTNIKLKKVKRRDYFAFRIALISFLVALLLYSSVSPSFAQSPLTLDGLVDAEYISHGHPIDYEGFIGVSCGTNNAIDLRAKNSDTWLVTVSYTLEGVLEVSS